MYALHLGSMRWARLAASTAAGASPFCGRVGHSAVRVGTRALVVIGGETSMASEGGHGGGGVEYCVGKPPEQGAMVLNLTSLAWRPLQPALPAHAASYPLLFASLLLLPGTAAGSYRLRLAGGATGQPLLSVVGALQQGNVTNLQLLRTDTAWDVDMGASATSTASRWAPVALIGSAWQPAPTVAAPTAVVACGGGPHSTCADPTRQRDWGRNPFGPAAAYTAPTVRGAAATAAAPSPSPAAAMVQVAGVSSGRGGGGGAHAATRLTLTAPAWGLFPAGAITHAGDTADPQLAGSPPPPLIFAAIAATPGEVVVTCGARPAAVGHPTHPMATTNASCATVHRLSAVTGLWERTTAGGHVPSPRHGAALLPLIDGHRVLLIGGLPPPGAAALNGLAFLLDLRTSTWAHHPVPPTLQGNAAGGMRISVDAAPGAGLAYIVAAPKGETAVHCVFATANLTTGRVRVVTDSAGSVCELAGCEETTFQGGGPPQWAVLAPRRAVDPVWVVTNGVAHGLDRDNGSPAVSPVRLSDSEARIDRDLAAAGLPKAFHAAGRLAAGLPRAGATHVRSGSALHFLGGARCSVDGSLDASPIFEDRVPTVYFDARTASWGVHFASPAGVDACEAAHTSNVAAAAASSQLAAGVELPVGGAWGPAAGSFFLLGGVRSTASAAGADEAETAHAFAWNTAGGLFSTADIRGAAKGSSAVAAAAMLLRTPQLLRLGPAQGAPEADLEAALLTMRSGDVLVLQAGGHGGHGAQLALRATVALGPAPSTAVTRSADPDGVRALALDQSGAALLAAPASPARDAAAEVVCSEGALRATAFAVGAWQQTKPPLVLHDLAIRGCGRAVSALSARLAIVASALVDNAAAPAPGSVGRRGGAAVCAVGGNLLLHGCRLARNRAAGGDGGAVQVTALVRNAPGPGAASPAGTGSAPVAAVRASVLEDNGCGSAGGGGALAADGGAALTVADAVFAGNLANGSSAHSRASGAQDTNSGAQSRCGGGALWVQNADVTVLRTQFDANSVAGSRGGGAVYLGSDAGATLTEVNATRNTATGGDGGAVHCDGCSSMSLRKALVAANVAAGGGGGVAVVAGSSRVSVKACRIVANRADGPSGGGGLRVVSSLGEGPVVVKTSLIAANNAAGGDGGGILWSLLPPSLKRLLSDAAACSAVRAALASTASPAAVPTAAPGLLVCGNTALYGPAVATPPTMMVLVSNATANASRAGVAPPQLSGAAMDPPLSAHLVDSYAQWARGWSSGQAVAKLAQPADGCGFTAATSAAVLDGAIIFSSLGLRAVPGSVCSTHVAAQAVVEPSQPASRTLRPPPAIGSAALAYLERLPWPVEEREALRARLRAASEAPTLLRWPLQSCGRGQFVEGGKTCEQCPPGTYSEDATALLDLDSQCTACPAGGLCPASAGGRLTLRPRYWARLQQSPSPDTPHVVARIVSCPPGYCCPDANASCTPGQCAGHRQGVLCGECEPGFSKALDSPACAPSGSCHAWGWVLPLLAVGAFAFAAYLTAQSPQWVVVALGGKEAPSAMPLRAVSGWKAVSRLPLAGVFRLVVFYLQIARTLIVQSPASAAWRHALLSFFNLEITGHSSSSSGGVCLWPGLTAAGKLALNLLPAASVAAAVALLAAALRRCGERLPGRRRLAVQVPRHALAGEALLPHRGPAAYAELGGGGEEEEDGASQAGTPRAPRPSQTTALPWHVSLRLRTLQAGVNLAVFAYSAVAAASLSLLRCVDVPAEQGGGAPTSVLFLAGSVRCYQGWQWLLLLVVLPLLFALPPGLLIAHRLTRKLDAAGTAARLCVLPGAPSAGTAPLLRSLRSALLVLEELYSEEHGAWEAALMLQRLLFSMLLALVPAPAALRAVLGALVAVAFLVAQVLARPFASAALNTTQSLLQGLLVVVAVLSLPTAVTVSEGASADNALASLEHTLLAVQGTILVLPLAVFGLILLAWLVASR